MAQKGRGIRKQTLSKRVAAQWEAIARGEPALLDDLDFSRGKPLKPRAKPQQREKEEVQRPLVVYLRKHLPAGSVVHANAIQPLNQNHRFAMQRDGVQFGMPDLDIYVPLIPRGRQFWHGKIECKHPEGGVLSASQHHTQGLLVDMGVPVLAECQSVAQAIRWLREQGISVT